MLLRVLQLKTPKSFRICPSVFYLRLNIYLPQKSFPS